LRGTGIRFVLARILSMAHDNTMTCGEGNIIPDELLARVPDSQGGTGRHRCVVCAYVRGVEARRRVDTITLLPGLERCRHNSQAPTPILAILAHSQAGPARHKCATCAFQIGFDDEANAEAQAAADVATEAATHGSDHIAGEVEGREILRVSREYERSPQNRAAAIRIHGTICAACGFDFDAFYGRAHARSYIEVHHLEPLAQRGEGLVDPTTDLRPLCANCHSMVHRDPMHVLPIEQLQVLITEARGNQTARRE
jgi:plasmid stability protein